MFYLQAVKNTSIKFYYLYYFNIKDIYKKEKIDVPKLIRY